MHMRVSGIRFVASAALLGLLGLGWKVCAPDPVPVSGAAGWRSFAHPVRAALPARGAGSKGGVPQPMQPAALLAAYDIDKLHDEGLTGAGQTVIVPALDSVLDSDLRAFAKVNKLPPFDVTQYGEPTGRELGELSMDLQIIHAMAPQAQLVVLHLDDLDRSLDGDLGVVRHYQSKFPGAIWSWSLGWCELSDPEGDQAISKVIAEAARRDGSVHFASSGDSGGFDCYPPDKLGDPPKSEYVGGPVPAVLPAVVAVGATRLAVDRSGRRVEFPWYEAASLTGSGGGWSRSFPGRSFPDVAADGDPDTGMIFQLRGQAMAAGGTSASAPFWAGLGALLAQDLAEYGGVKLGPMPELLSWIGAHNGDLHAFSEPARGSNGVALETQGHDAVTGWGTPNAVELRAAIRAAAAQR